VAGNAAFLKLEATRAWLGQFDPADQGLAGDLLRAMMLVSRDAFAERLRLLILQRLEAGGQPVGLYAERELRHRFGRPHRLFKQAKTKVKRAFGVGPPPVQPTRSYDADVGSEGLVAQIVSELCREQPKRFFNHPGPDQIRKEKIRRFVLITDFIGSGKRARTYLEAAWRVRSVRSWWSARANRGLCFEVVAYAAASAGRAHVERHPSKPLVSLVTTCPTISSVGSYDSRKAMVALCNKYSPVKPSSFPPLGFGSAGVLIAFAHGIPNNAPAIFHKRSAFWAPLFPARVTSATRAEFSSDDDVETVRARLVALRQTRLASAGWVAKAKPRVRNILLTLAALSRSPRTPEAVSGRTGLTVVEVEQALARGLAFGWIDGRNILTDAGHAELAAVREGQPPFEVLPDQTDAVYYPRSLRAPSEASS
jgi:hypothetical protein